MQIIEHGAGIIELITDDTLVKNTQDWSDLFPQPEQRAVIIKRENLNPDFFDLKTGFAGEVLQKFSTYQKKLAILGDFSDIKSKAFQDFLYESNKTRQILFVKTTEEALSIFKE